MELFNTLLGYIAGESYEIAPISTADGYIFATFLSFWFAAYYEVVHGENGKPDGFDKSTLISNLHSVPLVILATASLWELIPESVPIAFSVGFFVVDFVDCAVRGDIMFLIHSVISLALNLMSGLSGVHRQLRSTSKGFFAEVSTPFLNQWKKTKTKRDFIIFFISFTLCRIIWVPFFLYKTYAIYLKRTDFILYPSILFVMLQLAWYVKMCTMVCNYRDPDETAKGGVRKLISKKEIQDAFKTYEKTGKIETRDFDLPEGSNVSYVYPKKQQ